VSTIFDLKKVINSISMRRNGVSAKYSV